MAERGLFATAARAIFRAPEAIASLFSTPARTFGRWDRAALQRPVFGLAALDAHASIPWRESEEPRRRSALAWPGYRSMFNALSQTVVLDAPLSGDARDDARRIMAALTGGRSFSIVRAFAAPASLSFTAEQGSGRAGMGDRVAAVGRTVFVAAVPEAPGATLVLLRNGRPVASAKGRIQYAEDAPSGVYRVEAHLADRSVPWIVSNPIVVGAQPLPPLETPATPESSTATIDMRTPDHPWAVEGDPTSTRQLQLAGDELRFDYRLGPGTPKGQYAALVGLVASDAGVDGATFTARADRPTRVSFQVKLPRGAARRWRRSVYLDQTPRTVTVRLAEFESADTITNSQPLVTPLHSILFVVDTLNSVTGSAGTIWVSGVNLAVREP